MAFNTVKHSSIQEHRRGLQLAHQKDLVHVMGAAGGKRADVGGEQPHVAAALAESSEARHDVLWSCVRHEQIRGLHVITFSASRMASRRPDSLRKASTEA